MRVVLLCLLIWLLYLVCTKAHAQPRPGTACLLTTSAARLGVREATGHNDGPEVEKVQRLAGARVGVDPWCGCERNYWNLVCGRPRPSEPAAAKSWTRPADKRTIYTRGVKGSVDSIKAGDTVTFYYANLGRIGHVGMAVALGRRVRAGRPARAATVRAGNTGTGGGREGAGVHDVVYALTDIYAASTW